MEIIIFLIIGCIIYIFFKGKKRPKERTQDIISISSKELNEHTSELTIEINEAELIKKLKSNKRRNNNVSLGDYEDKIFSNNTAFFLKKKESLLDSTGWIYGEISLYNNSYNTPNLMFVKKIARTNEITVTDSGNVFFIEYGFPSEKSDQGMDKLFVYNKKGEVVYSYESLLHLNHAKIANNEKIIIFRSYYSKENPEHSNKIFIIDLFHKKLINIVDCPIDYNDATIDSIKKIIKLKAKGHPIYEIDFEGNQLNFEVYETKILEGGDEISKITHLKSNYSKNQLCSDDRYLNLLLKSLNNNSTLDFFGKDKILRSIGEIYYSKNDIESTIKYWKLAIELNPKVGVKRKLDKLLSDF